jgi:hypothetical protein
MPRASKLRLIVDAGALAAVESFDLAFGDRHDRAASAADRPGAGRVVFGDLFDGVELAGPDLANDSGFRSGLQRRRVERPCRKRERPVRPLRLPLRRALARRQHARRTC